MDLKLLKLMNYLKTDECSFMFVAEKLRKCFHGKKHDERYLKYFDVLIDIKETRKSNKFEELKSMLMNDINVDKTFASAFNNAF